LVMVLLSCIAHSAREMGGRPRMEEAIPPAVAVVSFSASLNDLTRPTPDYRKRRRMAESRERLPKLGSLLVKQERRCWRAARGTPPRLGFWSPYFWSRAGLTAAVLLSSI
jgi:hypothetical protein